VGRRRAQQPRAEFGRVLDQRLRHLGLTPAAFAARAGLSVSHVYQLLRGDRTDPRGTTLRKIAAALGLSDAQLMTSSLATSTSAAEDSASAEAIDRASFFALMSAFPTGVTIVSTLDESGQPRGLTCTMTCSVSAEPPLLLVCIDKQSNTLPALRHTGRFVVNYLRDGRAELSNRFATHSPGKWTGVAWKPSKHGIPCLHVDSLAYAECRIVNNVGSGDHVIFVGRVEGGRSPAPGTQPLIYFRRTYTTCGGSGGS
jgi:flavin reductase (DIM6/NTAB) family NADH-FMN oxidoreductase RutF